MRDGLVKLKYRIMDGRQQMVQWSGEEKGLQSIKIRVWGFICSVMERLLKLKSYRKCFWKEEILEDIL